MATFANFSLRWIVSPHHGHLIWDIWNSPEGFPTREFPLLRSVCYTLRCVTIDGDRNGLFSHKMSPLLASVVLACSFHRCSFTANTRSHSSSGISPIADAQAI